MQSSELVNYNKIPKRSLLKELAYNKYIYLLLTPGIIFYLVFNYGSMWGILMAFQKYMINKGIFGSQWIGFQNFKFMFEEPEFWRAFNNTLIISFGKIITGFPIPIILALLINELKFNKYKRVLQTVFTFPNFLSWIIVSGFIITLFSSQGTINNLIALFGMEKRSFLTEPALFRGTVYISEIWKSSGWSSIIYLASMSSIDSEMYEAADLDGANRLRKIWHITLPEIKPMIILLLLLSIGNVMNAGFDQIFNIYNPLVYETGDVIDTYIYRMTFNSGLSDYGFSTAVGLFKSIINFALLFMADRSAKLFGERGIF